MANVMRKFRRISRDQVWPVDKTEVFDVGDLLVYNSATVLDDASTGSIEKAGDVTWDTSEEVTRRNAASQFVGLSLETRDGKDDHDSEILVPSACVALMPMTSGTPKIGTLLGFEKASGNALEDAKLQIVTYPADAIGYCVKRYTAATTEVECVLISPFDEATRGMQNLIKRIAFGPQLHTGAADLLTNFTFGQRVKLIDITTVVTVLTAGAGVLTLRNGANSLNDTHTVADASPIGAVATTAINDASSYDIFEHNDPLDIASDGVPTAGEVQVILRYMPLPHVA